MVTVKAIIEGRNGELIIKDMEKHIVPGKIFPNTYYTLWTEDSRPSRKGGMPGQNSGSL